MTIKVNGKYKKVYSGITVSDLLSEFELLPERVAVELNLNILNRGEYSSSCVNDGDCIEIISFVGGGSKW